MGTNFYFKAKKNLTLKVVSGDNEVDFLTKKLLNSIEDWEYIHIGKRSGGWKPLFQENQWFDSVKTMEQFYNKNKVFLDIVNEYDEFLTWVDLVNELILWNKDNDQAKVHIGDGLYRDYKQDGEGYDFTSYDFS